MARLGKDKKVRTGDIFDGYRIVRAEIARGGIGVVHEAVSADGKRVAIKVLDKRAIEEAAVRQSAAYRQTSHGRELRSSSQPLLPPVVCSHSRTEPTRSTTEKIRAAYKKQVDRFKEEYQTLVGLSHPNVARVLHTGFYQDCFYIVSEFIDGKPISEFSRGLSPAEMVPLFIQALEGLDFIQRSGYLHLDIKSSNVLVQVVNGRPHVKIIDFSLAMEPYRYSGAFVGSLSYMAPEIAFGQRHLVDARTDLFSLGVLMYYCLTAGKFPFARPRCDKRTVRRMIERELAPPPPSEFNSKDADIIPEYLDTIVMRLIEKHPHDRFYTSARSVLNALAASCPDASTDVQASSASYLMPDNDRHVGQEYELIEISCSVSEAIEGIQPWPAVFGICGPKGTGKTHFLKKVREYAEYEAELLTIHHLTLPASNDALSIFAAGLEAQIVANELPLIIFVDSLDVLAREVSDMANASVASIRVWDALRGAASLLTNKRKRVELEDELKPMLIYFTSFGQNAEEVFEALCGCRSQGGGILKTVELKALDSDGLREFLRSAQAFKGKDISGVWIEQLISRTGGVQAEIIDYLKWLAEEGRLQHALDGEIIMPGDSGNASSMEDTLPETTKSRLLKIYASLPADEKDILDFMSVWSIRRMGSLPDEQAFAVCVPKPDMSQHLSELVRRLIMIQRSTGNFALANDLFAHAVYHELDAVKRETFHTRIADYLEKERPADREAMLFHRGFGNCRNTALRSLVRLARLMLYKRGFADFAAELILRTIELSDPAKVKLMLWLSAMCAESHLYNGKVDTAYEIIIEAIARLDACHFATRALKTFLRIRHAMVLMAMKRFEDALKSIECIQGEYRDSDSGRLYIELLNCRAKCLYSMAYDRTAPSR